MEKRVFTFVVLTMLVLLAAQYLSAPQNGKTPGSTETAAKAPEAGSEQPQPATTAGAETASAPAPGTSSETFKAPASAQSTAERLVRVETPLYIAELSTKGGTIKSWTLKKYADKEGAPLHLLASGGQYRALSIGTQKDFSYGELDFGTEADGLALKEGAKGSVIFTHRGEGVSITRKYTFDASGYAFELEDTANGLPGYSITLGTSFGIYDRDSAYTHVGPVVLEGTDREEFKAGKVSDGETVTGSIKWIALEDKYFFAAAAPGFKAESAEVWDGNSGAAVALQGNPGETNRYLVYAGPKIIEDLKALGAGLEHIVDFGFFSIIARPIFWLLKRCHDFTGNYGFAIILLTIIIRVPFIPIVQKGQKSMKKMQELQPKMAAIREKYKKDPDRMNREVMALYQKHKVNPVGGCLPLLLQIPVFFALYKVLLIAIELRGAPFVLWITDLSAKDPYYVFPIVMGLSMYVQQKMSPAQGDPTQQKIFQFLPLVFTFMFLSFPSGLVIYWLVNNLLSIAQQFFINRAKSELEPAG